MCDEREKLIAYLYDEVDASDRRLVEAHLTDCATCRDELRAFRDVRQDLLAFDVPEHESVWKPFATPQPAAVWRQLPAWAMAAAATLVFATGIAGGFAGRMLADRVAVRAAGATATPPQAPAPSVERAAVQTPMSADEVKQLETRIAELEQALRRVPAPATVQTAANRADDAALLQRVEQLIRESEGRVNQKTASKLLNMSQEMYRQRARDVEAMQQQITYAQAQTTGSLLKVMNTRDRERQ